MPPQSFIHTFIHTYIHPGSWRTGTGDSEDGKSLTNADSCPCRSKYYIKMCLIYRCSHYWLEWCFFLSTKHCLSKHCLTISWRSLHPAGVYANEGCWLQYTKALQINLLRFLWIKGIISPKECEISGGKKINFFSLYGNSCHRDHFKWKYQVLLKATVSDPQQ